uniref:Exonuclease n=1 Tax=Corynebacterium phage HS01 TaxID=3056389 RepID=A0AA49X1W2_9VIRU|nr:MAG: exonuclease [Corynebacterium phage HS01]
MKLFKPANEDEWHEYRRQHLTSTELRDLSSQKASPWKALREKKTYGDSFTGNAITRWGESQEPLIAATLDPEWNERLNPVLVKAGESPVELDSPDTRLRYNSNPQTIIINPDDERLCGTPDLFSEDGEVIGEIKTRGHALTGGKWHEEVPDGYYLQCQANLWHTGAQACVLRVEERLDAPEKNPPFKEGEQTTFILTRDEKCIEHLKRVAEEWFAWLDGTTPDWMGEVTSLEDADEVEDLVAQLADAEKKATRWSDLAKEYKKDLLKLLGDSYAGTHAGYKVSVSTTKDTKTFDSKAFKTAHPDLFAEFNTKTRRGSTRLRLTKVVN